MSGEGCLHGNLRRLQVTNLTNHDFVGILAKESTQCAGEIKTYLVIHRNLHNAVDFVLNRVFCSENLGFDFVYFTKRTVECGGLA